MKYVCFFIFHFLLAQTVNCQTPFYKNFNVDNGLASNQVFGALEDRNGFIWFATDQGVNKYNSYEFKTFTVKDGLPDNTVFGFHEDWTGKIWIRSLNGVLSYIDDEDEIMIVLPNKKFGLINSLYVDKADTVWFNAGSKQYKVFKNNLNKYIFEELEKYFLFRKIDDNPNGCIVGCYHINNEAFIKRDLGAFSVDIFSYFEDDKLSSGSFVGHNLSETESLMDLGRYVVSVKNNSADIVYRSRTYRQNIQIIGKQEFFLGGPGGVIKLDSSFKVTQEFLRGVHVTDVIKDKEEGYWFCTLSEGVYYAKNIDINVYNSDGMGSIKHMLKDKSNHLIAVSFFGDIFYSKGSSFTKLYGNKLNEVEAIYVQKNENDDIVIGSSGYNMIISDLDFKKVSKSKKCYHLDSVHTAIPSRYTFQLLEYGTDTTITEFKHSNRLVHMQTYRFGDTIYIPTLSGLFRFDLLNGFQSYGDKFDLLKKRINTVCSDKYNRLWIGTSEDGILLLNGDSLIHINGSVGFAGNICKNVITCDQFAWASTELGLIKISLDEIDQLNKYTSDDGLLSNSIQCIFIDEDTVLLGHGNGITKFPMDYSRTYKSPILSIDEVRFNNEKIRKDSIYDLAYDNGPIQIDYTGISYSFNLEYAYRLKSTMDTSWNYTSKRNVEFVVIPPGKYVFEVYCFNEDGVRSEASQINFFVSSPFWTTWWFITIVIILFFGFVYLFIKYRFKQLNAKIENERKMIDAEQQALRARMNPHFIFNSLNSIQKYLLTNDRKNSNKYLTTFSKLMRLVLDNSKESLISIEDELKSLQIYLELESMRFKDKFEFNIIIDPSINVQQNKIPPLLLQPYIENAIWHGIMHKEDGTGTLKIELKLIQNRILCVIEDNGIGRVLSLKIKKNNTIQYKSTGMAITSKRMELVEKVFGQKIIYRIIDRYNNDKEAIGTRVEIDLPIIKSTD